MELANCAFATPDDVTEHVAAGTAGTYEKLFTLLPPPALLQPPSASDASACALLQSLL